jgi:hypothetical protein
MKQPKEIHYEQLCKVISYLFATADLAIHYRDHKINDQLVHTFADAGEQFLLEERGRHTTGIIAFYNQNPFSWSSRRQTVLTGDICEAELFAINSALRNALIYRNLLQELEIATSEEQLLIPIYNDNQSAIDIGNDGLRKHSKHYNLCLMYVKDYVDSGELHLEKVASAKNYADLLTKFVDHGQFGNLWPALNLERTV